MALTRKQNRIRTVHTQFLIKEKIHNGVLLILTIVYNFHSPSPSRSPCFPLGVLTELLRQHFLRDRNENGTLFSWCGFDEQTTGSRCRNERPPGTRIFSTVRTVLKPLLKDVNCTSWRSFNAEQAAPPRFRCRPPTSYDLHELLNSLDGYFSLW